METPEKPRILVVEDDIFLGKIYRAKLQRENFDALLVTDGDLALSAIREKRPDFVILDLILPQKDGFQVLNEMHADEALKNIPVIVYTTLAQAGDAERVKQMGAREYFVKTETSFDEVITKIKSSL